MKAFSLACVAAIVALAAAGCGSSSSGSSATPSTPSTVGVRFVEGAPALEANVAGSPVGLGAAFLTVNGTTIASQFPYGGITPYASVAAGKLSLKILDSIGYAVGPLATASLVAGKTYSVVVVGSFPNYQAIAFEDPAPQKGATLAVYAASPSLPSADYGS